MRTRARYELDGLVVHVLEDPSTGGVCVKLHPVGWPEACVTLTGTRVDELADRLKRDVWRRSLSGGPACGNVAGPYFCTLEKGHGGEFHEAHGLDGEHLGQWERDP